MLKYVPHKYQERAEDHVMCNPNCGLFLDMGLGKTVVTLTCINRLIFEELEVDKVLVIAPKRVAESTWSTECSKWSHLSRLRIAKILGSEKQRRAALQEDAHVYVVNRENVAWLVAQFGGHMMPFDMLVIDELSSFKSPKAQRFKELRRVLPQFTRVVGLTGTPAPNGLIDLWSQMYILDRGERLGRSITKFRQTYFTPGRRNGATIFSYELLPGQGDVIRDLISDICISMKASDYLDLPESIHNPVDVWLPEDIQAQYNDFEKKQVMQFIESGQEVTAVSAASLLNKLLQFASGAVYTTPMPGEKREVLEIHDEKLDALESIVEDANGQPVLVAWAYQHGRDRIMRRLKKYKPRELKTSQDVDDWNAGKIQVLLAHPASAGHGLNLQDGGHIVVWYGLTWSLELYQQFNKRLDRQGQKHSVIFHYLIAKHTEDERVLKVLEGKSSVQEALLDGLKAKVDRYKALYKPKVVQ